MGGKNGGGEKERNNTRLSVGPPLLLSAAAPLSPFLSFPLPFPFLTSSLNGTGTGRTPIQASHACGYTYHANHATQRGHYLLGEMNRAAKIKSDVKALPSMHIVPPPDKQTETRSHSWSSTSQFYSFLRTLRTLHCVGPLVATNFLNCAEFSTTLRKSRILV